MHEHEAALGAVRHTYAASPRRRWAVASGLFGVAVLFVAPGIWGIAAAWNLDADQRVPTPLLVPAGIGLFAAIYGTVFAVGAWRRAGERFELYDGGFVHHACRRREVYGWEDIQTAVAWEEQVNGLRRLFGHDYTVEIVRDDGRTVRMDGLTPHARDVGPVIAREALAGFRRRVPRDLAQGKLVRFGPLVAVDAEALYAGGKSYPWDELPEVKDAPLRLDLGPHGTIPLLASRPDVFAETADLLRPTHPVHRPGGDYPDSPHTPVPVPEENSAGCMIVLTVGMGLLAAAGGLMLVFLGTEDPDFTRFAWLLVASPFICFGLSLLLKRPSTWAWVVSLVVLVGLAYALVTAGSGSDGLAIRLMAASPLALAACTLLNPPVARHHLRSGRSA